MITLIDPHTRLPFPSVTVGGRTCFAIPFNQAFAVKVAAPPDLHRIGRGPPSANMPTEAVIAVDGRDTLSNQPASPSLPGVIIRGEYTCPGFQIGQASAASFVHAPKGLGLTTAERNGTPDACGLVAAVLYARRVDYGRVTRGGGDMVARGVTRGAGGQSLGGAMAGEHVTNNLGTTSWERGEKVAEEVIEYDTREGWAARGVIIPETSTANPWPGVSPRFANPASL